MSDGDVPVGTLHHVQEAMEQMNLDGAPKKKTLGERLRQSIRRKKPKSPSSSRPNSRRGSIDSIKSETTSPRKEGGMLRSRSRRKKKSKIPGATDSRIEDEQAQYYESQRGKNVWLSKNKSQEIMVVPTSYRNTGFEELEAVRIYGEEVLRNMLDNPIPDGDGEKKKRTLFGLRSPKLSTSPSQPLKPRPSSGGEPKRRSFFGTDLQALVDEERIYHSDPNLQVPVVVLLLVAHLEANGLKTEGIFRKSGSTRRVRELNEKIESGDKVDLSKALPQDVAASFKYFLRNLPEPLLTYRLYLAFLDVAKLDHLEDQILALRLLCALLPPANRSVLELLLLMANKISKHAEENLMDASNLAVVLAPNVLRSKHESEELVRLCTGMERDDPQECELSNITNASNDVIELMINYAHYLFVIPADLRNNVLRHISVSDKILFNCVMPEVALSQSKPAKLPEPWLGADADKNNAYEPTSPLAKKCQTAKPPHPPRELKPELQPFTNEELQHMGGSSVDNFSPRNERFKSIPTADDSDLDIRSSTGSGALKDFNNSPQPALLRNKNNSGNDQEKQDLLKARRKSKKVHSTHTPVAIAKNHRSQGAETFV